LKNIFRLLLLFMAAMATAQSYSVNGVVRDFHDNTPLAGAVINVGKYSAVSDSKGNFNLKTVPKGTYFLTANHPQCEPFSEEVTINRNVSKTISMEHHMRELETVVLNVHRKNAGSLVVSTLDKDVIRRNVTDNLGEMLTAVSGVGSLKTGGQISKPIIHGLYGSRISVLNNGVKLAEQEWGVEHAPNVDPSAFDHIDVIKGASALKFGAGAVGGVVVLEPQTPKKIDTLIGSVTLSGISNGRGAAANVGILQSWQNGWAMRAGGSYRKTGDLQTPDYNLTNTGAEFSSFDFTVQKNELKHGFAAGYSGTHQNIGIYRGSHIGSLEDFYRAIHASQPLYTDPFSYKIGNPRQEVAHHILKLSGYRRLANLGKLSATYSFQLNHRKEFDVRRGELAALPSLDLELITHNFHLNHLLERGKWSLESGVDFTYQNNYSNPGTLARRLIPNYDEYLGGVYSVFKYRFSPHWNVEAAGRFDHRTDEVIKWFDDSDWQLRYAERFPQYFVLSEQGRTMAKPSLKFENMSLNAGVEYHASSAFNAKFNYARVGRAPNIAELFSDGLHHSAAIIEIGNLALKSETGHQFNLALSSQLPLLAGLQLSVNPYLFLTNNFINEVPTGIQNTIRGVFPIWSYRQVDALMYGIDADAALKFTPELSWQGRFSYVYGQDKTNDQPLILMLPPNVVNAVEFSSKHKFNIGIENRLFFKQTRYPMFNPTLRIFENGAEVEKTLDLSTPPSAYALWTVSAGAEIARNLSVNLKVDNLFDTAYRDYLNRLRYFSDETGRSFILSFRYQF